MISRPQVAAFDVLETLFSLQPLRPLLLAAGLPVEALELWFAQILRSGFALAASDTFHPFKDVARGNLEVLLVYHDRPVREEVIEATLAGFSMLTPHEDVEPAFRLLRERGLRALALSNGSAQTTRQLFHRTGLAHYLEHIVSIEDVGHWKPRREVYLQAPRLAGVPPGRVALVAAHAWDVHGAHRAGLIGPWVRRRDQLFLPVMGSPDVSGNTLVEVCQRLADLPE